jgi:hypothetical protein
MVSGWLARAGVRRGQGRGVSRTLARAAAVADRRVTGLSREVLAELVAELGPRWQACREARLADRPRRRAVGAGARHRLVFIDRLLATLVHLRHGVTHDVLGCWLGVSRSTITRAVGEVRPLLAERGCTVEDGIRLRTGADVVAHLGASGQLGLLDATEVRVRRPAEESAAGLLRGRRGARGRTPGSRGAADPRGARHQPPEELAGPLASPRPTGSPRRDAARGRRTGLQPGTSPPTWPA